MIQPVARCQCCLLSISSDDITRWAEDKRSREWWMWQLEGLCELCSDPEEYAKHKGVKNNGY